MRSRNRSQDQVAEVARRRLEQLSAELAGIRPASPLPDAGAAATGPGEPPSQALLAPPGESAHASLHDLMGVPPLADAPWPADDTPDDVPPHRLAPWPEDADPVLPTHVWGDGRRGGRAPGAGAAPARPGREPGHPGDTSAPVPGGPAPGGSAPGGPAPTPRVGRHARRGLSRAGRLGGWVADRLPEPLQGRVALGASQLALLAVAVAAALAVTAWWVVRADRSGTPVPSAPSVGHAAASPAALVTGVGPAAGTTAASAGASPSSGVVVVDVAGKVRRPGIVTLPVGARVVDALNAAGGARHGVRLDGLNLARVLTDGEQILVGVSGPGGVAAPAASGATGPGGPSGPTTLVNINTADQTQLESLPGVGPVTAQKILQWRTDNGPFAAVDDLLDVSGIGEATLAEMAPFVTL